MIAAVATGWTLAVLCALAALRMHRRLERVADAEHELRGALTAFGLGVDRFARTAVGGRLAAALESELHRARSALADLSADSIHVAGPVTLERLVRSAAAAWGPAARGRHLDVDWRAGRAVADAPPGRVAQVLGNLVSNAAEHGAGPVAIRALPAGDGVRLEVSNATRSAPEMDRPGGRGLRIARRATRAAGGRLTVASGSERVTAAVELPVER